jgi:hypothetical protein
LYPKSQGLQPGEKDYDISFTQKQDLVGFGMQFHKSISKKDKTNL